MMLACYFQSQHSSYYFWVSSGNEEFLPMVKNPVKCVLNGDADHLQHVIDCFLVHSQTLLKLSSKSTNKVLNHAAFSQANRLMGGGKRLLCNVTCRLSCLHRYRRLQTPFCSRGILLPGLVDGGRRRRLTAVFSLCAPASSHSPQTCWDKAGNDQTMTFTFS